MPRRNRNPRTTQWDRLNGPSVDVEPQPLTTDQMARDLVNRGLASPQILETYKRGPRPHPTEGASA